MLVRRFEDVEPIVYGDGLTKRVVIGPRDGAPTFVMRVFDLPAGKTSPQHRHDWEHEGLLLTGEGTWLTDEGETPIKSGEAFFVAPNEKHCLVNKGQTTLRFVCFVPLRGEDAK